MTNLDGSISYRGVNPGIEITNTRENEGIILTEIYCNPCSYLSYSFISYLPIHHHNLTNKLLISHLSNQTVLKSVLRIRGAEPTDSGVYQCGADYKNIGRLVNVTRGFG